MIESYKNKIIALSPVHIGGDSVSTIRLPYLLHLPQESKKIIKIDKENLKIFVKCVGSFYRNSEKESFGMRSFADIFKDRVFASLMSTTISTFFSNLARKVPLRDDSIYQYITKFALSLSRDENIALIQWARANIDVFVTSAVFCEDSKLFKDEFEIDESLCTVEIDTTVPVIPGNSIRGHMRRCLMQYVFEKIFGKDIRKELKAATYHTFFTGGMLTSSDGYINIEEKVKLRDDLPFLSIFGAMLGKEDMSGKMNIGFAFLDCSETDENITRDGMSFLKEYFMTRRDDFEGMVSDDEKSKRSSSVQMIYSALCVETGSSFSWDFQLKYLTDLEKSFFDLALLQLQRDGTLGGMARAGYGKINIELDGTYQLNIDLAEKYLNENKEMLKKRILEM
jgi:CRISPR/Cas system CSM-associated protein Csm3 (group 7 of RAMP superfamily)